MSKVFFNIKYKNIRINNIPDTGLTTGYYFYDYYGCWYEYITDKESISKYIVGEYPV